MLDRLEHRIADPTFKPESKNYARAEAAALRWVLSVMHNATTGLPLTDIVAIVRAAEE